MLRSWKTSVLGVLSIICGLTPVVEALLTGSGGGIRQDAIAAVVAGLGLLLAKDHDQSGWHSTIRK